MISIKLRPIVLLLFAGVFPHILFSQNQYSTNEGILKLKSNAPLEIIEAESNKVKGIIDIDKRALAFSVEIRSFQGFNSPLQREHFNENYMESNVHPQATFTGKFIEDLDFDEGGAKEVRVKGTLNIHGVKKERIIKGTIENKSTHYTLKSNFKVLLSEHQISVPRIVFQKIAKEIEISLHAIIYKSVN